MERGIGWLGLDPKQRHVVMTGVPGATIVNRGSWRRGGGVIRGASGGPAAWEGVQVGGETSLGVGRFFPRVAGW